MQIGQLTFAFTIIAIDNVSICQFTIIAISAIAIAIVSIFFQGVQATAVGRVSYFLAHIAHTKIVFSSFFDRLKVKSQVSFLSSYY